MARAKVTEVAEVGVNSCDKPLYTVEEFVKTAKSVFGGRFCPDIIRAAMKMSGKEAATKEQAEEIIKKFADKEVQL